MAVHHNPDTGVFTETGTGDPLESLRNMRVPQWTERGLCATRNPEVWFPVATSGRGGAARMARKSAEAKAICAECPVRIECLEFAFEADQKHGVWGGMDELERRALKARPAGRS